MGGSDEHGRLVSQHQQKEYLQPLLKPAVCIYPAATIQLPPPLPFPSPPLPSEDTQKVGANHLPTLCTSYSQPRAFRTSQSPRAKKRQICPGYWGPFHPALAWDGCEYVLRLGARARAGEQGVGGGIVAERATRKGKEEERGPLVRVTMSVPSDCFRYTFPGNERDDEALSLSLPSFPNAASRCGLGG